MSARAPGSLVLLLLLGAAASGTPVRAADAAPATAAADTTATADGLHYLVPELRGLRDIDTPSDLPPEAADALPSRRACDLPEP